MAISKRDPITGRSVRTHGMADTPTYQIWANMKDRCANPNNASFERWYGGAGISVCERWATSFENFLVDMGKRPSGMSLDRIDGTKGYEPGNCRWATDEEQHNNKKSNRKVTYNGVTQGIAQWARATGIGENTLYLRHRKGFRPPELFMPSVQSLTTQRAWLKRKGVILVAHNGETKPLAQWAQQIGMTRTSIGNRYKKGLRPPELFLPPRK